jgi:hypothetical protein
MVTAVLAQFVGVEIQARGIRWLRDNAAHRPKGTTHYSFSPHVPQIPQFGTDRAARRQRPHPPGPTRRSGNGSTLGANSPSLGCRYLGNRNVKAKRAPNPFGPAPSGESAQ